MIRAGIAIVVGLTGCVAAHGEVTGVPDYPTLQSDDWPIDPYATAASATPLPFESVATRQVGENIPVDVAIGDPRAVEAMVVRLRVGTYELPSGPNHLVEREADGVQRVTIRAVPGAKVTAAERKDALRETDAIDARDPAIRRAAAAATIEDAGDRARVSTLINWVYVHVTYEIGDTPVASSVLANRKGDCSEMSLLFVAMARAVGIPARPVVGLAATYEDGSPAFGYHAWAEVELDGKWVQVDPTWNEDLADATHIELMAGEGEGWGLAADGLELAVVDITRAPASPDVDPRELARQLPVHLRLR